MKILQFSENLFIKIDKLFIFNLFLLVECANGFHLLMVSISRIASFGKN